MASLSFDNYLRDVRLSVEDFAGMSQELQELQRDRYIKWLELKNPQPAEGTIK